MKPHYLKTKTMETTAQKLSQRHRFLKAEFTEDFFKEFQFDSEFRSIFGAMTRGLTPYQAIEHLCKSKKELFKSLEKAIENTPRKIIVTTERFEELRNEINQ